MPTSAGDSTACLPLNTQRTSGKVIKIVDGDTIDVQVNQQTYRVRYIGINAPETTNSAPPGVQAARVNSGLVYGKTVTLVKDISETDQYQRLLRYVLVEGVFVNYEMVRQGYASAAAYPPDVACQIVFQAAERYARENALGLWAEGLTTSSTVASPTRTVNTRSATVGSGGCDPAYPTVCIPPPPPNLDCADIPFRKFVVKPPDPHHFDSDGNGYGCER